VPEFDPFLFSQKKRAWISDQWLADFITYKLFDYGSWPLLYKFFSLIFLSIFIIVPLSFLSAGSGNFFALMVSSLVAMRLSAIHFILRPVLIGMLFFSVLYALLIRHKINRSFKATYFAVISLFILWANIHPSFVVGLALVLLQGEGLLFILSAAATLLNPYGYKLHQSIFELANSTYFMGLNNEWLPLSFSSEEFLISIFIFIFCFYDFIKNKRFRKKVFIYAPFIVFFILLFHSVRFLPYFAISSVLPLSNALSALIDDLEVTLLKISAPSIMLRCFCILLCFFSVCLYPYNGRYGPSEEIYPYDCMQFLSTLKTENNEISVLAHPNMGGFITLFGVKPVIDDRNTMQGEITYRYFFENMKPGPGFLAYINSLGSTYLLLSNKSKLLEYLKTESAFRPIECPPGNGNFLLFRTN
jgi:hypothetical protein